MKNLIAFGLILLLATFVYADLTSTLDTVWIEKNQRDAAFLARGTLENMTNNINEGLARLQEIKDSGDFDTLPPDLKTALNAWWQIYKDAKAEFQTNPDLIEVYQWHP